jgi:hypothetical protein
VDVFFNRQLYKLWSSSRRLVPLFVWGRLHTGASQEKRKEANPIRSSNFLFWVFLVSFVSPSWHDTRKYLCRTVYTKKYSKWEINQVCHLIKNWQNMSKTYFVISYNYSVCLNKYIRIAKSLIFGRKEGKGVWKEGCLYHISPRFLCRLTALIMLLLPFNVRGWYIWKTADLLLQLWVSTFPRFMAIGFY